MISQSLHNLIEFRWLKTVTTFKFGKPFEAILICVSEDINELFIIIIIIHNLVQHFINLNIHNEINNH